MSGVLFVGVAAAQVLAPQYASARSPRLPRRGGRRTSFAAGASPLGRRRWGVAAGASPLGRRRWGRRRPSRAHSPSAALAASPTSLTRAVYAQIQQAALSWRGGADSARRAAQDGGESSERRRRRRGPIAVSRIPRARDCFSLSLSLALSLPFSTSVKSTGASPLASAHAADEGEGAAEERISFFSLGVTRAALRTAAPCGTSRPM